MEDIIVENVDGIVNQSVDSLRNTHVSQEPTKLYKLRCGINKSMILYLGTRTSDNRLFLIVPLMREVPNKKQY